MKTAKISGTPDSAAEARFHIRNEALDASAHRTADLLTEIYRTIEQRPVVPETDPAQMEKLFGHTLGETGVGLEQLLDEFHEHVLPNSLGTPHPLYLGLVNCSPLPGGVLGDTLVSALNNNGGARHQSPAGTPAEQEVLRMLGELCYGDIANTGMFVPGGSYANLQGLLLGRRALMPEWDAEGPAAVQHAPRVYTGASAHFSVQRAAAVIGLGEEGVVSVACDQRGAMDPDALTEAMVNDEQTGAKAFAVMATAGTTGTGAIDPLETIADITDRFGLWLHVDAAYGGGALLLDELRDRFAGIERADSITVDAHKWFFAPVVAGVILTRHLSLDKDAFRTAASYIPGEDSDCFRRGIGTSRRCTGLSVWMALRAHGLSTVREAIRRNIRVTRYLEDKLAAVGFDVLPGGELSVACARWPNGGDTLQQRIAEAVVATGEAWFSTTLHAGRIWLRFNSVNLYVSERHMDHLVDVLCEQARRLTS